MIHDPWNAEETALLVKLWKQNWSARQIAIKMKKSRNSIIGKIKRVRDKTGEVEKRKTGYDEKIITVKKKIVRVKSLKQARIPKKEDVDSLFPKREIPVQDGIARKPVPFSKLTRNKCKYVVNEGHPSDYLFCNEATEIGKPFCPYHLSICYTRPTKNGKSSKHNSPNLPRNGTNKAAFIRKFRGN